MGRCAICGRSSYLISDSLGVCLPCLRNGKGTDIVKRRRESWRDLLLLPLNPPRGGPVCNLCSNRCEPLEGERGFCNTIINAGGIKPITGNWRIAVGTYYLDPLPTNCVASSVCPAATCRGYPEFTDVCGPEVGGYNLAVFYGSCNLDCFFCQNSEHKVMAKRGKPTMSVDELVREAMRPSVNCICYFGGDPAPWSPHSLAVSRKVLSKRRVRVCWETNGMENPKIFEEMMKLAVKSGGIVKIDLKAWNPHVFEAITGVKGLKASLKNIERGLSGLTRGLIPLP